MTKTLALVTDLHLNEPFTDKYQVDSRAHWLRIVEDIKQKGIKDLMILGDLSEGEGLAFFFQTVKEYGLNLKLVLGNHDSFHLMSKHINLDAFNDLKKLYYAEEDENYKYFYLDSSAEIIDDVQLNWFEKELKTEKEIIVFIHHPIIDCKTEMDKIYPLKEREKLETILKSRAEHAYVFCGHYHTDNIQTQGLITQIVTPACSIQLNSKTAKVEAEDRRSGYRILKIEPKSIQQQVLWF